MTSNTLNSTEAYVWVWLPNEVGPTIAGKIVKTGEKFHFTYGRSYRENKKAIALSPFELPLQSGTFIPQGLNTLHSCLRDAGPDAWGRRLIDYKYPHINPNELDYLLLSGNNRIGALHIQKNKNQPLSRAYQHEDISIVEDFAEIAEKGNAIPKEMAAILQHGTSIGGARPKCLLAKNKKNYIAKFSLSNDFYPIIKAEYIAMRLAKLVGINVANVELEKYQSRDILLIERFDRIQTSSGEYRRLMLSGLSLLGLNEMEARYASYLDLADTIRHKFNDSNAGLKELFKRLVFNILVGNTDDHARNHSAFWDGKILELTAAYDICPQQRSGHEATQAMAINGKQGNLSTLVNALSIAHQFNLDEKNARSIINKQIEVIRQNWLNLCSAANLTEADRENLWGKTILSQFCLQGWNSHPHPSK